MLGADLATSAGHGGCHRKSWTEHPVQFVLDNLELCRQGMIGFCYDNMAACNTVKGYTEQCDGLRIAFTNKVLRK